MQDVLHGHGDLPADLLQKLDICFFVAIFLATSNGHSTEPPTLGGQRDGANRPDTGLSKQRHLFWKSHLLVQIIAREGLLMLPNPTTCNILSGILEPWAKRAGRWVLQHVHAHHVPFGIMKRYGNGRALNDAGESVDEIAK